MKPFSKKQILLVNPPIEDFYQTKIRQETLGLAYLAAVLRQTGFNVTILDALAGSGRKTIELPPALKYLKVYYPQDDLSPFRLFTSYFHFGKSWQALEKEIARTNPALIGISANFTAYFSSVVQVARICKQILPKVPIVVGGHHVTACPTSVLKEGCFDWVVLGEGERTFRSLVMAWAAGDVEKIATLPGIAFLSGREVQINPPGSHIENPDELPHPVAPLGQQRKMILTSRGCPLNCEFCTIRNVMGKKIRLRSIESVLDEIAYWQERGFQEIDFEDDNLLFYPRRAEMLFREIINRFGKHKLRLSAMNGVSATKLDETLLQLMARAGFEWLNLPLVSGNEFVQKQIHRNQSRAQFLKIVRQAAAFNLKIVGYLILGLPDDTLKNMITDILMLAQELLLIGPSVFYPPPGSAIFDFCVNRNYIQRDDLITFRSTAFSVETEKFSRTDLVSLLRIVRLINYIKALIDTGDFENLRLTDWLSRQPVPDLQRGNRLTQKQIGIILLQEFFLNKSLKGMKLKSRFGNQFNYEMIEYKVSHELIARIQQAMTGLKLRGVTSNSETRI